MADPQVIKVTESNSIDQRGNVSKVVNIQYIVGTAGPFTLAVSPADIASGEATRRMREFAAHLSNLPLAPGV